MSTHGALTEPSLSPPIGKGREGNRRGREDVLTHCMTVTGGTAQTRGLSDVSSCNATNSIEHLDYDHKPPCEADYDPPHPIGEAAATWILRVSSECGHQLFSFGLFCGDCKACYDRRRWECLTCAGEFRLSWEPLR